MTSTLIDAITSAAASGRIPVRFDQDWTVERALHAVEVADRVWWRTSLTGFDLAIRVYGQLYYLDVPA